MALQKLPDEILAVIIKKAGEGAHWRLGPFIRAGKVTKKMVFEDNVLKSCNLDSICEDPGEYNIGTPYWEERRSRNFFKKCLGVGNPDACYAEGIKYAARGHPLEDAINLIAVKVPQCQYATLASAIFHMCIGNVEIAEVNLKLIFENHAKEGTNELRLIGENLKRDVDAHGPGYMSRHRGSFKYPEGEVVRTPDCVVDGDPHDHPFCETCYLY